MSPPQVASSASLPSAVSVHTARPLSAKCMLHVGSLNSTHSLEMRFCRQYQQHVRMYYVTVPKSTLSYRVKNYHSLLSKYRLTLKIS